jgi:hypothetical protein
MSREQDYFPPQGTKFKWGNKELKHLWWNCNLSTQKEPKLFLFPLNVHLAVDLRDGLFHWDVKVTDFIHNHSAFSGTSKTAIGACCQAEDVGEAELAKHLPRWVKTALRNKWRSPCPPRFGE